MTEPCLPSGALEILTCMAEIIAPLKRSAAGQVPFSSSSSNLASGQAVSMCTSSSVIPSSASVTLVSMLLSLTSSSSSSTSGVQSANQQKK